MSIGKRTIRDPLVNLALRDLNRRLRARFGSEFDRLILFGSRARGDNAPVSDAYVEVIMRNRITNRWSV